MTFIGSPDQLVIDRYTAVPTKIVEFVGSVAYKHILDVGCGEMMCDFRLVEWGAQQVTGYDIIPVGADFFPQVRSKLIASGLTPPDHEGRLDYQVYDGENFPAQDQTFDIVFSWGVFEHVANVPRVLREMNRVLKPGGVAFVSVFPWWPCYYGSHVSDFIEQPFFHLTQPDEWVQAQLDLYGRHNPQSADLVARHMWREYQSLNRLTLDEFYEHVLDAGFKVGLSELGSYRQDLRQAPRGHRFTDLMACSSSMALHKE